MAERPAGAAVRRSPARSAGLRDSVRRAVAETLNMPVSAVAVDKPFADYGLDSILGAELVERLRSAVGIRLEQRRLYDFGSVVRLEGYIAKTFPDAVAQAQGVGEEVVSACDVIAPPTIQSPQMTVARSGGAREPIAVVGISGRSRALAKCRRSVGASGRRSRSCRVRHALQRSEGPTWKFHRELRSF